MQVAKPKKGYKLVKWYYGKEIEIPKDWDMSTIGKIGKYVNGFAFKPSDWKRQGVPIIRIQNLTDESESFNYCDKPFDKIYEINKDDLLISWSASLDIFKWNRQRAVLNQHIFKATPNKNIDRSFFYFAVSERIQDMKKMIHGSTMQHITKKPFLDTLLPLPSLPEQKQIAYILSNVDDTLQKTNQIIEQTQRLKEGLINKIVQKGIGITLFTYNKNQPIPPKHQLVKLHEAVQINPKYQCDQNKEYPFVEMAAINEETKLIDYLGKRKLDSGYAVFKNDDVLFAHITPSTEHGKVTLAKNFKEIGLGSTELTVLKPKESVDKDFLSYYVQTDSVRNFAVSQMEGTTGRQRVPTKVFTKDLYILLPPLPEQKQIASILSNIDTQIQKEKLHKSNLERLKKGLMQKLLTGQIRVKIK